MISCEEKLNRTVSTSYTNYGFAFMTGNGPNMSRRRGTRGGSGAKYSQIGGWEYDYREWVHKKASMVYFGLRNKKMFASNFNANGIYRGGIPGHKCFLPASTHITNVRNIQIGILCYIFFIGIFTST